MVVYYRYLGSPDTFMVKPPSAHTTTTDNYLIRLARTDDLPHLFDIERAATLLFKETAHYALADYIPNDQEKYRRFLATGAVYVASDRGENLVGFVLAEEIGHQGFLTELYVYPEHGRRGIGRQLIDAVKRWCIEHGYTELRLSTFIDVEWNAPYYARLGFRPIKETDLTPDLLAVRVAESVWGFDVAKTVFMTLSLNRSAGGG